MRGNIVFKRKKDLSSSNPLSTDVFVNKIDLKNSVYKILLPIGRLFEIALAATILLVFSPLMLLTALSIYLTDRGSIIYSQERVGLNGRVFFILKFRTMSEDAEKNGPQFTVSYDDPRTTPVGKLLRRTKLDELPQLWNVIRADMTFVGPRPERTYFHDKFANKLPGWTKRVSVKPGVTGLAQLNTKKFLDAEKKIELDLYYLKNRSFWMDAKLLIKTLFVVWG